MKKIALIALLCISTAFAQEKKYQSLLWEVSGNGLTKKSYLYGSMHVSDKVSYHLSDAFFTHLLNADIVANESEPSTWTDLFGMFMAGDSYYIPKFYAGFYQKPVVKEQLYQLFRSNNFTLNNLLFRTNEYHKEYQEETYLDMFIYRTGRKYNKKTVGLEDTKKSIIGIVNANLNFKPLEENRAAIQKILKNNNYEEALTNFYRDKDLDMIDSLTTLTTSEGYLKAMLYDRNVVMVNSIDSLVKQGSLFAAVGAAHLPGKKGIIEMLRSKGYIVTPIFDGYTEKGRAKKQQIEEYFSRPAIKNYKTADGVIEMPLFTSVIENNDNMESPDLANGGYINVKRLPLRDYLKKDNKPFDHKSLDSLFYENIPGNILDKKFYVQDGYTVYDIKSITKTGNAQRYKYYISPLEVISVAMSGEGNYVRQFETEIYNNLKLKPITSNWAAISPKKGGFTAQMPEYTIIYGDRSKATVPDVEMYSYDPSEKANYFIIERTLHEKGLEDSDFEMKRIHYEFYRQFDADTTNTKVTQAPYSLISASSIGSKTIRLKSFINGSKYYLLGTVGASENNSEKFFAGFAFTPYNEQVEFRTFTDSTFLYKVDIPKNQNERLDFVSQNPMAGRGLEEKVNHFREKYNEVAFTLASGETISLTAYKYHRYENRKPIDSLWRSFREMVAGRREDAAADEIAVAIETAAAENLSDGKKGLTASTWNRYFNPDEENRVRITNEKTTFNKAGNYHQIDLTAVDDRSQQAIKYRGIYRDGHTYVLSALVDKNYKNNNYPLERIFNSFTLLNDPSAEALPQDRLELFIKDAKSEHDSIRYSAIASIHEVKVTEENAEELIRFLEGFEFKPTETNALVALYCKLGYADNPLVVPFLDKKYKQATNTNIQFAVLEALTRQKSREAYKKIMELLEHDLPLPDGSYQITSLFRSFEKDTKNSEVLFPDILQFYSIDEYHQPIVDFAAALLNNKSIRPGKLNSYKKMILTNAKLELKRVKSRKASQESEQEYDEYYSDYSATEGLTGYINLLYPYRNEKSIIPFFNDCKNLQENEVDLELARLAIANKNLDKKDIERLLGKQETLYTVYNMLLTAKENKYADNITDAHLAESAFITMGKIKTPADAIAFLQQKEIKHNNQTISLYFFSLTAKKADTYMGKNERVAGIAFVTKDGKIDPFAYKYIEPMPVADEDAIPDIIDAMTDETVNGEHLRASFGKAEKDYNEMLFNDYGY